MPLRKRKVAGLSASVGWTYASNRRRTPPRISECHLKKMTPNTANLGEPRTILSPKVLSTES